MSYDSTYYYSESQQKHIHVDEMVLPYARNVLKKCLREDAKAFAGSPLCNALMARLMPSNGVIKTLLATKGKVAVLVNEADLQKSVKAEKARIRRIADKIGADVEFTLTGDFLEATCEPVGEEAHVRIKHTSGFRGSRR